MSVQLQIEEMSGYLAARFIGEGAPEEVWRQFELIAEHCDRTNNNKLLVDATGAQGPLCLTDRYYLGERSHIFARHGLKLAFVATREQIDPQLFGEMVARNRGVNARVFTDLQAAEEWLLK